VLGAQISSAMMTQNQAAGVRINNSAHLPPSLLQNIVALPNTVAVDLRTKEVSARLSQLVSRLNHCDSYLEGLCSTSRTN
jgi:hypothetical protein